MPDDLDTKTDAELNEAFAVEVAEYVLFHERRQPPMSAAEVPERWCYRDRDGNFYLGEPYPLHAEAFGEIGLRHGYMWARPKFCTDANAVLPWLEKCAEVSSVFEDSEWFVGIGEKPATPGSFVWGSAPTFARAAVIALIRAKRAGGDRLVLT